MYYFFLSCARGDNDLYVQRFFGDLSAEVRVHAGASIDEEVGFLDARVEVGTPWSVALTRALATCRTFVALWSPAYFLSESCGREWATFSERVRVHERLGGRGVGAMIPVSWVPPRHHPLPPADAAVPYQSARWFSEPYQRNGLRQLLRLQRHQDGYLALVTALAEQIVRTEPVPPLPEEPSFDRVTSAFHAGPVGFRERPEDSLSAGTSDLGTRRVHLVVAAANQRQAATVRENTSFYGERAADWAPYRPALPEPVAELARTVAEDRGYLSVVADITELAKRVEYAQRHNEIIVMLLDAWTTQMVEQRRALAVCDQYSIDESNYAVAVLVPANADDAETHAQWDQLSDALRAALPRLSASAESPTFRKNILTHWAFAADLGAVLEVARNRIFARGRVLRIPAESPLGNRPILEGP